MSESETPKVTRRQHITREEEADRCLNHTVYSHGSNLLTVVIFLVIVFAVPITQHVVEIRRNLTARSEWKPDSGQPEPGIAPQVYDVFKLLPTKDQISQAKGFWGYWDLIPSMQSIDKFETKLKSESVLTTSLLSPTQYFMTKFLGAGNEKAYVGKDGWLFYRPDVEYLTTPGFLDPVRLKERSHGATAIQPNPVTAILDFKEQLKARGIQLVVMPMSTKPMIYPEKLAGPGAQDEILQNDSFAKFQETLEANGVPVFDPTPTLLAMKKAGGPEEYLWTDTHWAPGAMTKVAETLADLLKAKCGLVPEQRNQFTLKPEQITNLGDIAGMLRLPEDQTIFPKQTVTVNQVISSNGAPLQADRAGDVLLLGDSFSNIFSGDDLHWGTSAGFAEQLSYAIGRPIDKIVMNGGGDFETRRDLATQLRRGTDRLAGKKVVVYEFSMRDLAQGDWRLIKLPQPRHGTRPTPNPSPTRVPGARQPLTNMVSQYKTLTVEPDKLDVSKHQKVKITAEAPKGTWQVSVLASNGTVVKELSSGVTTVDHTVTDSWDGTDIKNKPVPAGFYTVRIEGERPDHTRIAPMMHMAIVVDAAHKTPTVDTTPPPVANPPTPINPKNPPPIIKPSPGPKTNVAPAKAPEEGLFVTGRIASRAAAPVPGSVPYKDCVIALQLTDLKATGGTVKGTNIVVYVWGMKDNKLVDGAYSVGKTIRFKLVPWASVDSKYGSIKRQELESEDSFNWDAFWGEIK